MPGPSFRPLIAALGAALLLAGLVFGPWLLAAGIIALSIALLGWLRDATGEYRKLEEADETGHLENLPDPRTAVAGPRVFAVLVVGAVLIQTGAFPPGQAVGGEPGASPGRQRSSGWRGRRRWRRRQQPGPSIPGGRRDDHRAGHQVPRVVVRRRRPTRRSRSPSSTSTPGPPTTSPSTRAPPRGPRSSPGEVFNGVDDQGLRRRPDPRGHVHVRLLGASVDDRYRQHQVSEDRPRLAVQSFSRCWSRLSRRSVSSRSSR